MVMIKVYHIDHQDHCSCAQVHTGAAVTLMLILRLLACDVAHQQTKDLARCARNNAKMREQINPVHQAIDMVLVTYIASFLPLAFTGWLDPLLPNRYLRLCLYRSGFHY